MTGAAAAILLVACCSAGPGRAETLVCALSAECAPGSSCSQRTSRLEFAIDRTQFAPPIDPAEPPRRKVTRVTRDGEQFLAEPILLDSGIRGFWTDDAAIGSQVLTIQPDGAAIYSALDGSNWTGHCRETG